MMDRISLEPPKVVQRPDSLIQINNEESVSIKCAFRGRPEPVISWIYNGEELIINGSPAIGGILSLNPPKEGIYQCIGRNPYGIAQANTALVQTKNTPRPGNFWPLSSHFLHYYLFSYRNSSEEIIDCLRSKQCHGIRR